MVRKAVIVGLLLVVALSSMGFGREIVVTSTADSGAGTLRLALQTARSGDVITFDPAVFPPENPATIAVRRVLPSITQGTLTIDASNAGIILDGQALTGDEAWGLEVMSNGNSVHGLQIVNFSGPGIVLVGRAKYNMIGGDRSVGSGLLGQGNLVSGNNGGICLWGEETSYNTIAGNLIGTDITGTESFGNIDGVFVSDGASHNTIGPDNVIAFNRENAIVIQGSNSFGNTITQNSIHDNGWGGIKLLEGGNSSLPSPVITDFNLTEGFAAGTTCPNCMVEVFSAHGSQGEIYEGQTSAGVTGFFTFNKGIPFTGSNLTAMTTDTYGNTSEFSAVAHTVGVATELTVASTENSGPGSLREVLEKARSGDSITFDSTVFPPSAPITIYLDNALPSINQGNLLIDASNTGVILDGSNVPGDGVPGLQIASSDTTIRGLQIVNFPSAGILLCCGAKNNVIGGDRSIGVGPVGQGNLCSGNSCGICLRDDGTSYNTITGNLIGTDITGEEPFGNIDGVFLSNGASHNIIGPDNAIAYNRERAIVIQGAGSLGNTITKNSIYDNEWGGIQLLDEGNLELLPPLISSFDLSSGKVVGTACANCTIELFTEERSWEDCGEERRLSAEGRAFEGITITTSMGTFSLRVEPPFSYSHLTATATDPDGNTSEFSLATSKMTRSWELQLNSGLPKYRTESLRGSGVGYNRIGTMLPLLDSEGMEAADGTIRRMDSLGFMWNKFYIDVPDWPEVGVYEGYSDGNVTPAQDALVDRFVERDLKIVLGLVFWDESANDRIPEQGKSYSRYETEEEVQAYLDHIQSIVRHFKGRIEYYEILNEPNAHEGAGVQQYVAADHYINLINRAVPIIRQEDPQAKTVFGAVASAFTGMGYAGYEYLFSILRSDVMPLVDVIAWHPFNGESPSDPPSADYYYGYPDLVRQIKNLASSNGFSGEYMGSEMFWRTPLTLRFWGAPELSPIQAAKYYARGITLHLGMDVMVGVGAVDTVTPLNVVVRNLCTVMAGHEAIHLSVNIDIETDGPVATCAFRYPNGDRILAVWTDGVAQDEDPGVPATITFPCLTAETVTGIDVLHGFEQGLVFEVDGENTIIRDLLVKDYPILIRFSDVTMSENYEETVGGGFHRLGDINALPSSSGGGSDRDGDGVPDDQDYCPDWPGSKEANGC